MQHDIPEALAVPRPGIHSILGKVLLHSGFLLIAVGLFAGYEHLSVNGQSPQSLTCLLGAAGFGLAPVRAVIGHLFALEGKVLHLLHGAGGLLLAGLPLAGFVSGGTVLTHAAMAPFALMGAAQAMMHSEHPRNAQQAAALKRFASSLPEIERFTKGGDLTSPQNAARAVAVLTDLIAKAQALGETELQADPGFHSALRQATARAGLTFGLDAMDRAINKLADNPATASAVPALRRELAKARRTAEDK